MTTSTASTMAADSTTPSNESVLADEDTVQASLKIDSMVTIRLSNSTIVPSECAVEDSPIEAPLNEAMAEDMTHLEESENPDHALHEFTEANDADAHVLEAEVKFFQRIHRMSTISMPSIAEEGEPTREKGSIRSRSDSSGTLSSAGSTHVDWEQLDKSEEAAPRDEGSDEVSRPIHEFAPL